MGEVLAKIDLNIGASDPTQLQTLSLLFTFNTYFRLYFFLGNYVAPLAVMDVDLGRLLSCGIIPLYTVKMCCSHCL